MLVTPVGPAARGTNIYEKDVTSAQRRLASAQARYNAAVADNARAGAELPAVARRADRLNGRAIRRRSAATRASQRAAVAVAAEKHARIEATKTVDAAEAARSRAMVEWRAARERWVSISALVTALAIAFAWLAVLGAPPCHSQRRNASPTRDACRDHARRERAGYRCALIAVLQTIRAWHFSWWAVAAAAVGPLLILGAVSLAWASSSRTTRTVARLGRTSSAPAVAFLVGAPAPAAIAADVSEPARARIEPATAEHARQMRSAAPMPERVKRLEKVAKRLDTRADASDSEYRAASAEADRVRGLVSDAIDRRSRAERAIVKWTDELEAAQLAYDDDYDELIDCREDRSD